MNDKVSYLLSCHNLNNTEWFPKANLRNPAILPSQRNRGNYLKHWHSGVISRRIWKHDLVLAKFKFKSGEKVTYYTVACCTIQGRGIKH